MEKKSILLLNFDRHHRASLQLNKHTAADFARTDERAPLFILQLEYIII